MLITDAAVREAAATLAQDLEGNWTLDPDAPADGAAHLIYSDGRAISFRPLFGGTAVQLWITGNAAPERPNGLTATERVAHEARIAARLPEGHRYNKATTLITDEEEEPAVIILRTLKDHLLPAFEYKPRYVGHQPWRDLFDSALAAVTAERGTPTAAIDTDEETPAEAQAESEAELQPVAEMTGEGTVEPEPGGEAQLQPSESDEQGTPPAGRRPRKRTPKRRPKASTT
ncbi:hypothetical protein ACFYOD_06635 [Streptomyces sp. NPDC006703]|uniref:hypothetical protein n=1 Tax=Streptomyces sp. NPDC006703 TaxID=3364759 RepID=UPI003680AAF9